MNAAMWTILVFLALPWALVAMFYGKYREAIEEAQKAWDYAIKQNVALSAVPMVAKDRKLFPVTEKQGTVDAYQQGWKDACEEIYKKQKILYER